MPLACLNGKVFIIERIDRSDQCKHAKGMSLQTIIFSILGEYGSILFPHDAH